MGAGRVERGELRAEEPGLAVLHQDVAVHDARAPGTEGLDLPPLQLQAGLEALVDEIVVVRPLVEGDGG